MFYCMSLNKVIEQKNDVIKSSYLRTWTPESHEANALSVSIWEYVLSLRFGGCICARIPEKTALSTDQMIIGRFFLSRAAP